MFCGSLATDEEQAAGQILLELRRLRKKYHTFSAQATARPS